MASPKKPSTIPSGRVSGSTANNRGRDDSSDDLKENGGNGARSDQTDPTLARGEPAAVEVNETEKAFKVDLLQRSLGLKHKIKVHDSMRAPETHEDLAVTTLARWELEDELRAIEALLDEARSRNVAQKRKRLLEVGPKVKKRAQQK